MEEWRDIPEFKGLYQVSSQGKVKSLERFAYTRTYPSQIIKPFIGNNNSVMVRLRNGKKQVRRSVAKLVVLAFIGEPPQDSKQIRHKDGNPNNNCLENLEWDICSGYYVEPNEKNRKLFYEKAEKMVDIFIAKEAKVHALKFSYADVDDYKQLCLFKIWKYIDVYNEDVNFFTFCATKCQDVFNTLYAKESKKNKNFIYIEDMATEKRPLDHIIELSCVDKYE